MHVYIMFRQFVIRIITALSPQHQKAISALSLCSGGINHLEPERWGVRLQRPFGLLAPPFRPEGLTWRPLSGQILMPNSMHRNWLAITAARCDMGALLRRIYSDMMHRSNLRV
jgi:hypothetical protein